VGTLGYSETQCIYTFSRARVPLTQFCQLQNSLYVQSCVVLYWQGYCGVVHGMELRKFCRRRHLYSAGRPSRWASDHILDLTFLSLTQNVTINVQIISAPQTIDVITIQISGNSHLKQSLNSQTALNNSFSLRSHNSFHYQLVTFILTFARHGNALAIKPWFRVKIKIKDFKMFSR